MSHTSFNLRVALACLALLAPPASAFAGKFNRALSIGDKAPQWSGLLGVDGRKRSLADYADAKLIVLVFTCNHCPVATASQNRLIALQKDFLERGVRLVAVCRRFGRRRSDGYEERRAESKGYNFPYLRNARSIRGPGLRIGRRRRHWCSTAIARLRNGSDRR